MLQINDSKILEIPVTDNNEPLVDLMPCNKFYLPSQIKTNIGISDSVNLLVRKKVKDKLIEASNMLPKGISFVIIECYRKYNYQKMLFNEKLKTLQTEYPKYDKSKVIQMASRYVSNPDIYSPHLTGAAVDLALIDESLNLLDVGNLFEHTDSALTDFKQLTSLQKENRQLLIKIMSDVGFINYPYEWWHWSYGDKYWGYANKTTAIYHTVIIKD